MDRPAVCDRDAAGFFGNDQNDRIRNFAHADRGPVTRTVGFGNVALRYGEDAFGCDDAVAFDDDGAVVIEGDRIVAAKCILPVTQSDVPKSYGTRHRAAIGMSEISDAIILVVSEETGGISIAHGGTIHRDIAPDQLANLLQRHFGANRQKDRHATMGS